MMVKYGIALSGTVSGFFNIISEATNYGSKFSTDSPRFSCVKESSWVVRDDNG
jgi:hypothetical protein